MPTADSTAGEAAWEMVATDPAAPFASQSSSRTWTMQLKRAMFLSAFAALSDPDSRTYHGRERANGKTHTQAILRLARRRINVLYAMLRDGAFYTPRAITT